MSISACNPILTRFFEQTSQLWCSAVNRWKASVGANFSQIEPPQQRNLGSELCWILFLELLRVVKPDGPIYLNAPSNGAFHRYPVDCWRFYPDSGRALVTWSRRNGYTPAMLESFICDQSEPNP